MEQKLNSTHFTLMKKRQLYFILILLSIVQCIFTFLYWQEKEYITFFFPIVLMYSTLHFYIYKNYNFSTRSILYATIPLHTVFIFTTPFLSDDIYRYIWDGFVSSNGINPYLYAPEKFPIESMVNNFNYFDLINHKQYSTLYLPIPELVFMIIAHINPSLIFFKAILFFFTLMFLFVILKLDRYYKLQNKLLFLVGFHPLIIYEISSSGHLDVIYVLCVTLAYYFALTFRSKKTNIFWTLAVFTRPLALIYLLFFKFKKRFITFLILSLSMFYVYLSSLPDSGLNAYSVNWHFNHPFFEFFRHILMPYYHEIQIYLTYTFCIKLISAIMVLLVAYRFRKKITNFESFLVYSHLLFTFLSPTIYPWYLIIVIPFASILKADTILVFTYTILTSYGVLIDYFSSNIWKESLFIIAFEYGVPVLYFYLKDIKSQKNTPNIKTT